MYFGFFNLGPTELIIILLIVLVLFGPKKLPEIGRAFGEMLTSFRTGTKTESKDENNDKPVNEDKDKTK